MIPSPIRKRAPNSIIRRTTTRGKNMPKFILAALAVAMISTAAQAQAPDVADPTVFIISYIEATYAGKNQVATQLNGPRTFQAALRVIY